MVEPVIDADGHIMEEHGDLFDHIRGPFGELDWHETWPLFDADGLSAQELRDALRVLARLDPDRGDLD